MMSKTCNSILYEQIEKHGYKEMVTYLNELGDDWLYRAQPSEDDLQTTLERECMSSKCELKDVEDIEIQMIRQFRRLYDGEDRQKIQDDILYCLSLMRHYGAPTRLLDFTYSKYVAIYFALECAYDDIRKDHGKRDYDGERSCAIWCIQEDELLMKVRGKYPHLKNLLLSRGKDRTRDNKSFEPLYTNNAYNLVVWENPIQLHARLHLQQGVFLCPGNVKIPFMENLFYPYDNIKTDKIKKIVCHIQPSDIQSAFEESTRMNVTRESLFPGLDGFAKSMKYQFWFYSKLAKRIKDSDMILKGIKKLT